MPLVLDGFRLPAYRGRYEIGETGRGNGERKKKKPLELDDSRIIHVSRKIFNFFRTAKKSNKFFSVNDIKEEENEYLI